MDLSKCVAESAERASEPRKTAQINRDAYPVVSSDFDAPGGTSRIVTRASTGAHMLEYEPEAGKVQRVDLAAIPAVGFHALTDEHRSALRELFPDDFGSEPQEPSQN